MVRTRKLRAIREGNESVGRANARRYFQVTGRIALGNRPGSQRRFPVEKIHSRRHADRLPTVEVVTLKGNHSERSRSQKSAVSAPTAATALMSLPRNSVSSPSCSTRKLSARYFSVRITAQGISSPTEATIPSALVTYSLTRPVQRKVD